MSNGNLYVEKMMITREVLFNFPRQYKLAKEELRKINQERQDLLHVIELGKLDAVKMSRMMSELKDVQKRRRKLKNEIELMSEVNYFLSYIKNLSEIEGIVNNTIGNLRKVSNQQDQRTYTMRIRKDLQGLVNERS